MGGVRTDSAARALLPATIRNKGTITFADTDFEPPDDFNDSNGTITGIDVDLGNALGKTLGLKVKWVQTTFDGLIAGELAGRWDGIMSAMNDTPVRQKQVTFVDYFKSSTSVLTRAGNPSHITDTQSLCGLTFADFKGSAYGQIMDELSSTVCKPANKPALKSLLFPDQATTYQAVGLGRAEAAMDALEINAYTAEKNPKLLNITKIALQPVHYGIGIDPKNPALIKAVQAALNKMISNGTYLSILKKWNVPSAAVATATINQSVVK